MTDSSPDDALKACNRFGFGARTGDLARAAADPRAFVKSDLRRADAALLSPTDPDDADLIGSTGGVQATFAAERRRKLDDERGLLSARLAPSAGAWGMAAETPPVTGRPATAAASAGAAMTAPAGAMSAGAMPAPSPAKPDRSDQRIEDILFRAEAEARFRRIASAEIGFVERLVAFWCNHFCVSVGKSNIVRAAAGAFEREAIRPFVLGRFADMLTAVERHPAMLVYLDNSQSVGPNSRAGRNGKRGLNENLAREILELHTVGAGRYDQADVGAFARILTGWTLAGPEGRLGEPGTFAFNVNAHEPGDATVLGQAFPAGGMGQGEAALAALARRPETAARVAFKLARHFVADDPPPALVRRLDRVFQEREGDLRAVAAALVDAPEAWTPPMTKLRSPFEFLMAARRATGALGSADPGPMLGALRALGQPLWQPPGPNGYPDTSAGWASPEGMKVRVDLAWQMARRATDFGSLSDLLDAVIGKGASPETRQAIAGAESKQQGLALLLLSPEFQRR